LRKNLSSNKNHTFEEDVKRQDSNVLLIGAGAKPCRSKVLVAGNHSSLQNSTIVAKTSRADGRREQREQQRKQE
jgi:hypothetical protein